MSKILEVIDLSVEFNTDGGVVRAVDSVSFEVHKGKTFGIVGESGSGKSVSALSIMGLIPTPPGKIVNGKIYFDGENILNANHSRMREIRGKRIAMIFQEPMTSLNPVFTIGNQIDEVLALHQRELSKSQRQKKGIEMLELVGIPSPEKRYKEYPHQLSGGMRQRIMIAMALACRPDVLIADEPTTALDVTIQAQILDLMKQLQVEMGMGIILITHDLGVVAEICHEVAVMYCGKIVETADVNTIFINPKHPYTRGLLNSIPEFDSTKMLDRGRLKTIDGMVPSLACLPHGCSFQNRCFRASSSCKGVGGYPSLVTVGNNHKVSCFHPLDNQGKNI